MHLLEPTFVPPWVTFSGLPVDYLSWEDIRDIENMVGKVDEATPLSGHMRHNLGYYAKIWFDNRRPLPARVNIMLENGKESFVRFIFEHIPNNFCLFCNTIKHETTNCPIQIQAEAIDGYQNQHHVPPQRNFKPQEEALQPQLNQGPLAPNNS